MNKQKILALKVVTVIKGVFFLVGEVNAQEGWNLQLEPMYMGVAGANSHFANITTSSGCCSSPVQTSFTTSQNFGMGGNGTFRGQLEYMPGDWGVGISGWWFDTSGSINQSMNASNVGYNSNNFTNSNGPGYWGLLKSSANNSLGVWNLDAYVIKSLGEFQNGGINLTFGAKFGSFNNNTSEAFNPGQTGFASSYFDSYGKFAGMRSNNITTNENAANSASASLLVGPSIGLQGSVKYGDHRLEGLLGQSVLIGNVNRKAFSVSYYSYQYSYYPYSYTTSGPTYTYNTSFSDSETVAIPVTEMKIKYLYDVTENLSLGLGFFASLWVDTPTPPAVQANDQQYKTLVFYGGLGSINLRY